MAAVEPKEGGIYYEVRDHVATITLDRPPNNAVNGNSYQALIAAFDRIRRDPSVRCVLLTAAGGRIFCSGDDVKQIMKGDGLSKGFEKQQQADPSAFIRPRVTPTAVHILGCDRPVVCAVNGAAVGWGMDLACMADIRVCASNAFFASLFVKRGLVPDVGGIWRLPRIVGPSAAADMLLTGRRVPAAEALSLKLVSSVFPADTFRAEARKTAELIAANPPLSTRFIKEGLRRSFWQERPEGVEEMGGWVTRTLGVLSRTPDHKEGVASFLEKRAPKYTGALPKL